LVHIVVVGMPGSGKDVFVRTSIERGFAHVRMGDVVRAYVRKAGLTSDDAAVGGFANRQRKEFGDDIWAIRTLQELGDGDAVIDGSRSLAEISHFKKFLGDGLIVVGIDASSERRFERLSKRRREDDPHDKEMFETRDQREMSWGLKEAIGSADIVLENNGSLEAFKAECRSTLDAVLSEHGKSINKVSHST